MVLLEDLEEQKSRLEAMLRDAQRERQDMQAAVNQDVSLQEPEVPAALPPAASEVRPSRTNVPPFYLLSWETQSQVNDGYVSTDLCLLQSTGQSGWLIMSIIHLGGCS